MRILEDICHLLVVESIRLGITLESVLPQTYLNLRLRAENLPAESPVRCIWITSLHRLRHRFEVLYGYLHWMHPIRDTATSK